MNSKPSSCTRCSKVWQISLKACAKSTSLGVTVMVPADMSEASRISLMRRSSMSQLLRMIRMNCMRSSSVSTTGSRSENPTMALSGVRISCDMLSRKALFCIPEFSARAISMRSCSCAFMRLVILREMPKNSVSCPSLLKMGMPETEYHVGPSSNNV